MLLQTHQVPGKAQQTLEAPRRSGSQLQVTTQVIFLPWLTLFQSSPYAPPRLSSHVPRFLSLIFNLEWPNINLQVVSFILQTSVGSCYTLTASAIGLSCHTQKGARRLCLSFINSTHLGMYSLGYATTTSYTSAKLSHSLGLPPNPP